MILIYVENKRMGEVAEVVKKLQADRHRIEYRNPRLFDRPEKCEAVVVHGDFPAIRKAYDKVIEPEAGNDKPGPKSTKEEIAAYLKESGIEFNPDAKKADLIALL